MPVYIDSIRFTDEYTGNIGGFGSDAGKDYLMACVGDKMWVEIKFHVAWSALDIPVVISIADNTITRTDVTGSFLEDGFHDGDTFVLDNAGGNDGSYTIDTVTNDTITTTSAMVEDGTYGSTDIYGTTDIDYIDFYYNLIANSFDTTFQSLSDVNSQKMVNVSAIAEGGTTVDLVPGTKQYAWVDVPKATATIAAEGTYGYPTYYQDFKIIMPFFVKPFYLNGQTQALRDLLAVTKVTPPEYFKDLDCLKFVYKINARYTATDPKVYHTSGNQGKDGNTGWFNELLDGYPLSESGQTQFELISTEYFDNATGYPVTTMDYVDKTDVQITIKVPGGTSIASLPFLVNFCWMPNSQEQYQNKGLKDFTNDFGEANDFRHLFLHDRAKQLISAGAVNGDRYGTDYQVITNVQGTTYSTNEIIITFTTDLGAIVKSTFAGNEFGRDYMIWVTPQTPIVVVS
jgi:hypothetical protein